MMDCIKNKLNNNQGASVLIALALLLICIMVSSVILVAAAGGSSRNTQRIRSQQEYYSLRSAAELLMKELSEIQSKKYIGREQIIICSCSDSRYVNQEKQEFTDYGKSGYEVKNLGVTGIYNPMIISLCTQEDWKKITYTSDENNKDNVLLDKADSSIKKDNLEFLILKAVENYYLTEINSFEEEFMIKIPEGEERLRNIHCKVAMDNSYNFTWYLKVENSNYAATISMKANIIPPPEENFPIQYLENRGHPGYYKRDTDGDNALEIQEAPIAFTTDLQYKDTIVSWEKPILEKGVELP